MEITIDQIEKYMGQIIKDEYGRNLGIFLTAYTDVSGTIESIEVATNDYTLERVDANRIKLTPDGVVVMPEWKVEALFVENKLDRVRRRIRSVEELYRKGMIPGHAYEEIKNRLDHQFKLVKDEVKKVKTVLRDRAHKLEDQIIRLEKDISNLLVLYMSNEVGENSYKAAIEYLRQAKSRNIDEKKDVEKHIELIEKLEADTTESTVKHTKETTFPVPSEESPIQVQIIET
jgi:hypothetical protein